MKTAMQLMLDDLLAKQEVYQNAKMYESVTTLESSIEYARSLMAREEEQLKEMYLKGIENYDPTFKRKSQWTPVSKEKQRQIIIDIMKADEDAGLYDENN